MRRLARKRSVKEAMEELATIEEQDAQELMAFHDDWDPDDWEPMDQLAINSCEDDDYGE